MEPPPRSDCHLCASLCFGNMVGFTWLPGHAAAEPHMNASLCQVPEGGLGLPSPCCRGCVREERLHSVYIIKTRRKHRGLQIQSLPNSGFISVFLSPSTLWHSDTLNYKSFSRCCRAFTRFGLWWNYNPPYWRIQEESACDAAWWLSTWLLGKPVSTFWVEDSQHDSILTST